MPQGNQVIFPTASILVRQKLQEIEEEYKEGVGVLRVRKRTDFTTPKPQELYMSGERLLRIVLSSASLRN